MSTDFKSKKLFLRRFAQIRRKNFILYFNLCQSVGRVAFRVCIICANLWLSGSGCATRGYIPPPIEVGKIPGIYHKVNKGETLWRISKTYDIPIEEVIAVNRIPEAARIYHGQLIFIPGAKEILRVKDFAPEFSEINFIWPAKGESHLYEKGIRILSEEGTDVLASRSGRVIFCGEKAKGYGRLIIIDHGDGFVTVYAHHLENLVQTGAEINQGSVIAKVGQSGRLDRPGLYFEIRNRKGSQNPFFYLP